MKWIYEYCTGHAKWRGRRRQHRTLRKCANAESVKNKHKKIPNGAPSRKNDIPRTAELHQMLRLLRMTLSRCTAPATSYAPCHRLTQHYQSDLQKQAAPHV